MGHVVKLHLGVIDVPYSDSQSKTTFDVAEELEKKYAVMGGFVEIHEGDIAQSLEGSLKSALENLLSGGIQESDPFGDATNEIEEIFKFQYLLHEEIATLGRKGVPTKASIMRRSLRFKNKTALSQRPSFIDTGAYSASFKAWIEE